MSDEVAVEPKAEAAVAPPPSGELAVRAPNAPPSPMHGEVLAPKRKRRRIVLPLILLAAVGGGGYEGYQWFTVGRFLVSTDDAYVKADTSTIAAKVAGYVAAVPIVENTHVVKGQVLATIDDGDYRNAVDDAEAKLATQDATIARFGTQIQAQQAVIDQAQAQVLSAKAEQTRTGLEYTRASRMLQSTFGTQQQLDQAVADRDRAAASVAAAQAGLVSAQAAVGVLKAQQTEARNVRGELETALAMAKRNLSFTTIRAPFDGVVGNKAVQPGQYVQTGTRLLALVPLASAYVEANFKETQLGRLQPGMKAIIHPDAYSDREIEGSVESVSPASGAEFSLLPPENATGNFTKIVQRVPVRIKIPVQVAEEGILRPGLSVAVDVHTRDDNAPKPSLIGALGLDRIASAILPRRVAANQQD